MAGARTGWRTFPSRQCIVVATRVVLIPVLLRPLQELQVILHLAFDEVGHGDGSLNAVFAEGVGEDFEVLEVGVVGVGVEFDACHGHVEEDAVVDLAEGGAGGG